MAVAKKSKPPVAVQNSKIQGRGVFATRTIRAGERIIRYVGESISPDEADRRYPFSEDERHHTFLFTLNEAVIVDAGGRRGNASKYINHSCDPNCEAVIEDDEIWVHALRTIRKGQELVYDYNFILEERHSPANKRLYPCYCGTAQCRGTILALKRKPSAAKASAAGKGKAGATRKKSGGAGKRAPSKKSARR
jgi:uncharacterized protein